MSPTNENLSSGNGEWTQVPGTQGPRSSGHARSLQTCASTVAWGMMGASRKAAGTGFEELPEETIVAFYRDHKPNKNPFDVVALHTVLAACCNRQKPEQTQSALAHNTHVLRCISGIFCSWNRTWGSTPTPKQH